MKSALLSVLSFGAFLLLAPSVQADDSSLAFKCEQKNGEAIVEGYIVDKEVRVKITDKNLYSGITQLGIYSYTVDLSREWTFEKSSDRRNESNYKYANYFNDNSPTQSFTISLPKNFGEDYKKKNFTAYFTVANDNGDMMVSSPSEVLNCIKK